MYPESLSTSESRCLGSLDRFASAHLDLITASFKGAAVVVAPGGVLFIPDILR